jgi:cardiolipin synthase
LNPEVTVGSETKRQRLTTAGQRVCGAVLLLAALFTVLWGCRSVNVYSERFPEAPALAEELAPEKPDLICWAREAFFDGKRFRVRLRYNNTEVYSEAKIPSELEGGMESLEGTNLLPILPLEQHRADPWEDPPDPADRVQVLPLEDWIDLSQNLMDVITPRREGSGVVVSYLDEAEYFLYRNEYGYINYVLLSDKPVGHRIVRTLDLRQMIRIGRPLVEDFLEERDVRSPMILFQTGDKGLFSYPWVLLDLSRGMVLFVQFLPGSPQEVLLFQDAYLEAAYDVFTSHLGILFRPISSLGRLFFIAADTAVETLRWTWVSTLEGKPVPPVKEGRPMDPGQFEAYLDSMTGHASSSGRMALLVDGKEFFPRLVDAMVGARRSINMRTYIFDNDDYALTIADVLKKRSREEVDVKVLVDGLGSDLAARTNPAYQPRGKGIPPSIRSYLRDDSEVRLRYQDNPWLSQDHVKTTTIDGKVGFVGGMNIGREYRYEWHDAMFEVSGPVTGLLENEFRKMWAHAGFWGEFGALFSGSAPAYWTTDGTEYPIRVLFTRAGKSEIFNSQLEAARRAGSRIYVQNAYFADDAILYELAKARRRGVDVRVIMALKADWGIMNSSNALAINAMLRNGIRVYLYPGMSHVKAAVYDGWACVGSANFDRASFKHNRELNLATSHTPAVDQIVQRLFKLDFDKSIEVTEPFPEEWYDRLMEILADQV